MDEHTPDFDKLAKLANIDPANTDGRLSQYFDAMLRFFDGMDAVGRNAPEDFDVALPMREDTVRAETTREELLCGAKTVADGCITVPLVMEDL